MFSGMERDRRANTETMIGQQLCKSYNETRKRKKNIKNRVPFVDSVR
jgi:hypothetical protein